MVYYTVSRYNEDMFLVGILSWWYGDGWRQRFALIKARLGRTGDYFSIELLLSTLFSPFRQISTGSVSGPLAVQMRAVFDRLLSRLIGALVRTAVLIVGVFVIGAQIVTGVIILALWALIPLFPVISLIASVIGWVPAWR